MKRSDFYVAVAWTAFIVLCVIAGGSIWLGRDWVQADGNQSRVAAVGLVLTIVGLLGTLAGFIVTFQQLLKVKGAAEASEARLDEARKLIATLAASSEIERAKVSLEVASKYIRDGSGPELRGALLPARQCILRIHARNVDRFAPFQDELRQAVADIASVSDNMDDGDTAAIKKLEGWLRAHVDLIDRLQVRMLEA